MRFASFGSVSSGTMRDEDLLDTLASELDFQLSRQSKRFPRKANRALIREARRTLHQMAEGTRAQSDKARDVAPEVVAELMDALSEFAPPYAYFGAHEGDGADFGFWLLADWECSFDGLQVDDTSEVPRSYRGEVMHVSDHGNMTLYTSDGRGKLRKVWGLV